MYLRLFATFSHFNALFRSKQVATPAAGPRWRETPQQHRRPRARAEEARTMAHRSTDPAKRRKLLDWVINPAYQPLKVRNDFHLEPKWLRTSTYPHLPAATSSYQHLPAPTSTYQHLPAHTLTYQQLPTATSSYRQVPARTSTYQHQPAHTLTYQHLICKCGRPFKHFS